VSGENLQLLQIQRISGFGFWMSGIVWGVVWCAEAEMHRLGYITLCPVGWDSCAHENLQLLLLKVLKVSGLGSGMSGAWSEVWSRVLGLSCIGWDI
jgi:hypothetical protein